MGANAMEAAIKQKRVTIWKDFMVTRRLRLVAVGCYGQVHNTTRSRSAMLRRACVGTDKGDVC